MSEDESRESTERWEPFRYFLGHWTGQGGGAAGDGSVERSYEFILNERFIQMLGRSFYPPQEKNPEGEVHEEMGIVSFDRARQKYVYREFHVEGYVNQYVVAKWSRENGTIVMETEAIENIPSGWRARTSLEILGPDDFKETFDLAGPGKPWSCYITNLFRRERRPQYRHGRGEAHVPS